MIMDDFKKRLMDIRNKGTGIVKKGLDTLEAKQRGVNDANRERNIRLMENASGGYRPGTTTQEDALLESPYMSAGRAIKKGAKKAGTFLSRLTKAREGTKEPWGPENQ